MRARADERTLPAAPHQPCSPSKLGDDSTFAALLRDLAATPLLSGFQLGPGEQIGRYQEVGCDQLVFGLPNEGFEHEEVLEMIELFGTEVIPELDDEPIHRTTRMRATAKRKYPDFAHPLPDGLDVSVIPTNALIPLGS